MESSNNSSSYKWVVLVVFSSVSATNAMLALSFAPLISFIGQKYEIIPAMSDRFGKRKPFIIILMGTIKKAGNTWNYSIYMLIAMLSIALLISTRLKEPHIT